jgi:hypothetical protein
MLMRSAKCQVPTANRQTPTSNQQPATSNQPNRRYTAHSHSTFCIRPLTTRMVRASAEPRSALFRALLHRRQRTTTPRHRASGNGYAAGTAPVHVLQVPRLHNGWLHSPQCAVTARGARSKHAHHMHMMARDVNMMHGTALRILRGRRSPQHAARHVQVGESGFLFFVCLFWCGAAKGARCAYSHAPVVSHAGASVLAIACTCRHDTYIKMRV